MSTQETNREENKYKDNSHEEENEHRLIAKEVKETKDEIIDELTKDIAKLKDPLVVASIMYTATREKENTNRILKNINAKLELLEEKIRKLEETGGERRPAPQMLLPEIDEQIVEYVKAKGKACAEEVQKEFKYKGRNAASARLNALFAQGMLEKAQVGRKVYYLPVE